MAEIDDIVTCTVCLGILQQPKRLPCNHYFCLNCLKNLDPKICPECGAGFSVDPETLPGDYRLQRLLELHSASRKICSNCLAVGEQEKCTHCCKLFCRFCLVRHAKGIVEMQLSARKELLSGRQTLDDYKDYIDTVMRTSLHNARVECHRIVNYLFDKVIPEDLNSYEFSELEMDEDLRFDIDRLMNDSSTFELRTFTSTVKRFSDHVNKLRNFEQDMRGRLGYLKSFTEDSITFMMSRTSNPLGFSRVKLEPVLPRTSGKLVTTSHARLYKELRSERRCTQ